MIRTHFTSLQSTPPPPPMAARSDTIHLAGGDSASRSPSASRDVSRLIKEVAEVERVLSCTWSNISFDEASGMFRLEGVLNCRHVFCSLAFTLVTNHNIFKPSWKMTVERSSLIMLEGEEEGAGVSGVSDAALARVSHVAESVLEALRAEWSPAFTLAKCFLVLEAKLNALPEIRDRATTLCFEEDDPFDSGADECHEQTYIDQSVFDCLKAEREQKRELARVQQERREAWRRKGGRGRGGRAAGRLRMSRMSRADAAAFWR